MAAAYLALDWTCQSSIDAVSFVPTVHHIHVSLTSRRKRFAQPLVAQSTNSAMATICFGASSTGRCDASDDDYDVLDSDLSDLSDDDSDNPHLCIASTPRPTIAPSIHAGEIHLSDLSSFFEELTPRKALKICLVGILYYSAAYFAARVARHFDVAICFSFGGR